MRDPDRHAALEAEAKRQTSVFTALLTKSGNKAINDEFDKLKARRFDVAWYRPGGPESVGKMAKDLGLESEYTLFYSEFSDITHAGSFDRSVKCDAQSVTFEPLRSPERIHTILSIVATLTFRIFQLIIARYAPTELKSFRTAYIHKWRARYRSIPKVVINAM